MQEDYSILLHRVDELMRTARSVEQPWQDELNNRRKAANDTFRQMLFDFRAIVRVYPQQFEIAEDSHGLLSNRSLVVKWKATQPERRLQVVLDLEHGTVSVAWVVGPDRISTWYRLDLPVEDLTYSLVTALADQKAWQTGNRPTLPGELSYADPFVLGTSSNIVRRPRPTATRKI